jgi:2-keto-4-pentenoate hydratase
MVDLSALTITLIHDGQAVIQGQGADVFGDPWTTVLWLVNHLIDHGWTMEPGQVLLSGALGKPIKAQPGAYEATFGPLGKLSVEIR